MGPEETANAAGSPETGSGLTGTAPNGAPLRELSPGIRTCHVDDIPWTGAGAEGIFQKAVRVDQDKGLYLGAIALDPFVRTGLHQHQATAISFIVEGEITDYQGVARPGDAGINLAGATHDAIAYSRCVMISRLEGPVVYLESAGQRHDLHPGSRYSSSLSGSAQAFPDINIPVDELPFQDTGIENVRRQSIFDYAGTGDDYRFVQLQLLPGARIPAHRFSALTECYVRAGDLDVAGETLHAGSFLLAEAGAETALATRFGCLLLAWAEGPARWVDSPGLPDLYGF